MITRRPLIVSVTGPESSGKSTLAVHLATYFNAPFSEEYARSYLSNTNGQYTINDLDAICIGQLKLQEVAIKLAGDLVIFDTDMLVINVWSKFRYGRVSPTIESALKQSRIDLYLLCKPDLEWAPDPFRESPDQVERDQLFDLYERYLKSSESPYQIISGNYDTRFQAATLAIKSLLKI